MGCRTRRAKLSARVSAVADWGSNAFGRRPASCPEKRFRRATRLETLTNQVKRLARQSRLRAQQYEPGMVLIEFQQAGHPRGRYAQPVRPRLAWSCGLP